MGGMDEATLIDSALAAAAGPAGKIPATAFTRRPLYLAVGGAAIVDLDGPALRVRARSRAPARYPLARISRVIAHCRVEWSSRALLACLERGIPIVVTNPGGDPAGYVLPALRLSSRLGRELEELLDRPDWHHHYEGWLRAERMRIFAQWQRRRETSGKPVPPSLLRELKRRHVYLGERPGNLAQGAFALAAVRAVVAERLLKGGLRARYWGAQGEPLCLLDDLAALLELALGLELYGLGETARFDTPAYLRVFHAFADSLTELCHTALGRLHRRINTFLEEWG